MSDEDVPVRVRLRGDRVLRRNRGEEDRGLLLRPLRQQPEGRRREHGREAEAAFPKKGNVDEYAGEYVAQSFGDINSAPLKSLGGEIARAIEEFVKGQAKPRLGNGLHPRKRTSAPFFAARGNGALSASSPHSLSGHRLLLPR